MKPLTDAARTLREGLDGEVLTGALKEDRHQRLPVQPAALSGAGPLLTQWHAIGHAKGSRMGALFAGSGMLSAISLIRQERHHARLAQTENRSGLPPENCPEGEGVGVSFYAFFANRNDDPELLMEAATWWIRTHRLDHFEKARKIIALVEAMR